jgi:hypothetical protein
MPTTRIILCSFLLACSLAHASSITAVAGSTCDQTASGASGSVSCYATAPVPGNPTESAYASASATFNGLDVSLSVDDGPGYYVNATASVDVTVSEMVEITGGTGSGTLIGTYYYNATSEGDFGSWPLNYAITQGDGGVSGEAYNGDEYVLPQVLGPGRANEYVVTSDFTYGVPFEVSQTFSGSAMTPGEEIDSFDFIGATYVAVQGTDPDTVSLTAVPETAAPEPGAFWLLAAGLVFISAKRAHRA